MPGADPAAGTLRQRRDTIAAIATASGRGGIGVVRVSGDAVPEIARALIGRLPVPRVAELATFCARDGEPLDRGIALFFAAPRSFTGEPVLELHGHGGRFVLQAVLDACLAAGARLAEPGEFTQRAFLEGKLDLAQAEAVADLVDASSCEAARAAMRSLAGEFSESLHALCASLIELRTLAESVLDFPEEDIDVLHRDDARARLADLRTRVGRVLELGREGSLMREGATVVLAGRPNVGKSSLLNRIAGTERAIVTDLAGTTRDVLRETVVVEGVPLTLIDTAGLREARDAIERIGVERARNEIARADLVLAVVDASSDAGREASDLLAELPQGVLGLRVENKIDLTDDFEDSREADGCVLRVSARTGAGIDALKRTLLKRVGWTGAGGAVFLARQRHLHALAAAAEHLAAAAGESTRAELFAEELRLAHKALGTIVGEFLPDDLLGEIFSRFCIGK